MSRQFKIIIKNEDLSEADVFMAIDNYCDVLLKQGEVSDRPKFDVIELDKSETTLIDMLSTHMGLDKELMWYTLKNECPSDYYIFKDYIQGQEEYCFNCGDCDKCWNSKPIKLEDI